MTPTELEAYDAMMRDRDRWRERAEQLESFCPSDATTCSPSDTPRTDAACAYLIRENKKDPGYANMASYSVMGVQALLCASKALERDMNKATSQLRNMDNVSNGRPCQRCGYCGFIEDADGNLAGECPECFGLAAKIHREND